MSHALRLIESDAIDAQTTGSVGRVQLKRLWWTLDLERCKSLLVLPTSRVDAAFDLATRVAMVGSSQRSPPVKLIDARGRDVTEGSELVLEMNRYVCEGNSVVAVADIPEQNPVGIPLALSADAVLLCITLGVARLRSVRETINLIEPANIIGCVALNPRVGA